MVWRDLFNRAASAEGSAIKQTLFSSIIDVLVRRSPAFSKLILSKKAHSPDNPINYAKDGVWPARCNTLWRNTESQLLRRQ